MRWSNQARVTNHKRMDLSRRLGIICCNSIKPENETNKVARVGRLRAAKLKQSTQWGHGLIWYEASDQQVRVCGSSGCNRPSLLSWHTAAFSFALSFCFCVACDQTRLLFDGQVKALSASSPSPLSLLCHVFAPLRSIVLAAVELSLFLSGWVTSLVSSKVQICRPSPPHSTLNTADPANQGMAKGKPIQSNTERTKLFINRRLCYQKVFHLFFYLLQKPPY